MNATDTAKYPLHLAAKLGDCDAVKKLLDKGVDVNAPDEYGYTPLYYALYLASTDATDCIDLLLSRGADIHRRSRNDYSIFRNLLYDALILDDDDDADYVLRRCDLDKLDDRGFNALHYAIRFGGKFTSAPMVRLILEAGADPCRSAGEGCSPLQLAMTVGDAPVVELLRHYDDRKATPLPSLLGSELMQAAEEGDLPRIRELLEAGANPDGEDWALELMEHPYDSPLFNLIYSDADDATTAEGTSLLLAAGANQFREDNVEEVPFLSAASANKAETMRVLLEAGADPHVADIHGIDARSAIFFSRKSRPDTAARCLMLLLDYGVSIMRGIGSKQRQDDDRNVPGCSLIDEYYEDVLKLLIARGYPLDESDDDGYTLLHYCADFGDEGRCAKLLLDAGANINALNKAGQTPLDMAEEAGNDELRIFLWEHGGKTAADLKGDGAGLTSPGINGDAR